MSGVSRDWEFHSALGKSPVVMCYSRFYPFRAYFPPFSQDNFATRGIDYDFYPSSEHVQWQEGENDRHLFRNFVGRQKSTDESHEDWSHLEELRVGTWDPLDHRKPAKGLIANTPRGFLDPSSGKLSPWSSWHA